MILTLYLGGHLRPINRYRASYQREHLIYQALGIQQMSEFMDKNIDVSLALLPKIQEPTDIEAQLKRIDQYADRKRLIAFNDVPQLNEIFAYKSTIGEDYTGDTGVDYLINLYKVLQKNKIIA